MTGGASGIGGALAERFLAAGARVLICGRREERLTEFQKSHPTVATHVCDVAKARDREELLTWATTTFPELNIVVNNAGIQRRVKLEASEPWATTQEELAINLEAPIHLSRLFIPHLVKRKDAMIVNATSGLAFAPLANVPVYCATKAGLHSFTLSLRHQLAQTPVRVVEIIPPALKPSAATWCPRPQSHGRGSRPAC